ncbi:MAG: hypothetical protein KDJ19_00575 [Hyphomicrobiaceae bacterium]|nr:hypothetical protein [Hyphomicrobiaceae bacterium]MCC0024602.1 hypothetical protein [Hyphomicrobiaceae bacterium]
MSLQIHSINAGRSTGIDLPIRPKTPFSSVELLTISRMSDLARDYPDLPYEDICRLWREDGFTDAEIARLGERACAIAGIRLTRPLGLSADDAARLAVEQSPDRSASALATLFAAELPNEPALILAARSAGWTNGEIEAAWADALAIAADRFADRTDLTGRFASLMTGRQEVQA